MKHHLLIAAIALALVAPAANAGEYLGLDLGSENLDGVTHQLTAAHATFDADYGYKGYGKDLQSIKVDGFDRFARLGTAKQSWLKFSPGGVLYQISVSYADAGTTFKTVKDGLDAKYGRPRVREFGFDAEYAYRDGPTAITLHRNVFGFGEDQTTDLTYTWTPLDADVAKAKAAIDADITKRNAAKVAKDL